MSEKAEFKSTPVISFGLTGLVMYFIKDLIVYPIIEILPQAQLIKTIFIGLIISSCIIGVVGILWFLIELIAFNIAVAFRGKSEGD